PSRLRDASTYKILQQSTSVILLGALTENGRNVPPKPDRINWLTAARHILRGQHIASQIQGKTYKTVCSEIEEYWRHKFYIALSDNSLRKREYFSDLGCPSWPENIEISSALVVIDFSNWQEDVVDPLGSVNREKLMKVGGGFKGAAGRGLESYVVQFEEIKANQVS
ncbi:MAG: hypothetical protein K2X06_18045, partial [Burkholderiales bacterium]|nr:hypothetical protein [Burkholderiales bacterium]